MLTLGERAVRKEDPVYLPVAQALASYWLVLGSPSLDAASCLMSGVPFQGSLNSRAAFLRIDMISSQVRQFLAFAGLSSGLGWLLRFLRSSTSLSIELMLGYIPLQAIKLLIQAITQPHSIQQPTSFLPQFRLEQYRPINDLIVIQQFKLPMRKHSLNHIGSHQHLKLLLHPDLAKKSHYFPESKAHRRENTRPKKYDHRKEAICGSWLYQSNKQNKNRNNIPQFGSKKGIKTTKKNSSSYIACNTSVQDTNDNKNFQTFNFANLVTNPNHIFKIPVAITDADVLTKESQARGHLQTIYDRFRALLEKYREELHIKDRKIKDLKKENKLLKEKVSKSAQRKG